MLRAPALLSCALLVTLFSAPARAQSGMNVLVVANASSEDSLRIAEHYARVRAVPRDQVLGIEVDASADEVERSVYDSQIQAPIAEWLGRNSAHDRILYIVLTRGIPLRIKGTAGRNGTTASVDSELTLLYRRLSGLTPTVSGSIPNPYYLADGGPQQAKLFTHADQDIYLVTRLDGFTLADTLALIDRGVRASPNGRIVLDQRIATRAEGDEWLARTAEWLTAHGFGDRIHLDATTGVVTGEKDVLGYYSWWSNDPANSRRHLDLSFVPGAIGGTFVSTDARTFREPPAGWRITSWSDRPNFFAGSPEALTGDLIRDGITGVSGSVAEPYLDATVRPNILFPAYVSGFNLAESFHLATPFISWQTVVIGDPLCAPFPRKTLQPADIEPALDLTTEMPAYFSARRLQALALQGGIRLLRPLEVDQPAAASGESPATAQPRRQASPAGLLIRAAIRTPQSEAGKAIIRAEARGAKGDIAGMLKALEEATAIDSGLNAAHLLLALAYEERGLYDQAIARYRVMIQNVPAEAVALNNLAYSLAVRKNQPAEALAYAEKAYMLHPSGTIADTLGWVQHLLGRDREAVGLLGRAVRDAPHRADIRLHAAIVYATLGMLDAAAKEFGEALKLDPSLANDPDSRALAAKLKTQ